MPPQALYLPGHDPSGACCASMAALSGSQVILCLRHARRCRCWLPLQSGPEGQRRCAADAACRLHAWAAQRRAEGVQLRVAAPAAR